MHYMFLIFVLTQNTGVALLAFGFSCVVALSFFTWIALWDVEAIGKTWVKKK
jgi:hypothetical protein